MKEMLDERYTVSKVSKERNFKLAYWFGMCMCCKKSSKQKYELGRAKQAKRKL